MKKFGCFVLSFAVLLSLFLLPSVSAKAENAVEIEKAQEAYEADGTAKVIDAAATFVAAGPGVSFVFDRIPAGGRVLNLYYATVGDSAKLAVSLWNGTEYEPIGRYAVPNSFGWDGSGWCFASFYLEKPVPTGAKLKLTVEADPSYGINMDYFWLSDARTKVEAEDKDSVLLSSNQAADSKDYGVDRANGVDSSGGAHQTIYPDKYYIYHSVAKTNRIVVAAAAMDVTMKLEVSYKTVSQDWKTVGSISTESTGGWFTFQEFTLHLEKTIPEGASVRFLRTEGENSNVDYFRFDYEPSAKVEAEDCEEAYDANGAFLKDGYTTSGGANGTALGSTHGRTYLYRRNAAANQIEITYATAMDGATITLYALVDGEYRELASGSLPNTHNWEEYRTATLLFRTPIAKDSTLKLVVGDVDVNLDSFLLQTKTPENPSSGDRFGILLLAAAGCVSLTLWKTSVRRKRGTI